MVGTLPLGDLGPSETAPVTVDCPWSRNMPMIVGCTAAIVLAAWIYVRRRREREPK